jgi:hypothetical protein
VCEMHAGRAWEDLVFCCVDCRVLYPRRVLSVECRVVCTRYSVDVSDSIEYDESDMGYVFYVLWVSFRHYFY